MSTLASPPFEQSAAAATAAEKAGSKQQSRLQRVLAWARVGSDFLTFVLVVVAVVLAAVLMNDTSKVMALKLLVVFYFTLLPAVLYLQFNTRRKLMVFRDYVANLYKLELDKP